MHLMLQGMFRIEPTPKIPHLVEVHISNVDTSLNHSFNALLFLICNEGTHSKFICMEISAIDTSLNHSFNAQ